MRGSAMGRKILDRMLAPLLPYRRVLGFLFSGGLAFLTDLAGLEALTRIAHIDPLLARLVSIPLATVVGWWAQRTVTFAVVERPSVAEFVRYSVSSLASIALNYAIFAGVIIIRPQTAPAVALIISSALVMIFSYLSMKYMVFRR
jgi:putative flippase GtrA